METQPQQSVAARTMPNAHRLFWHSLLFVSRSGPLQRLSLMLLRIPLLGPFLSSIVQLIFSIQRYYFYTSAS